jgi:Sec-independent protein translocase protein TatA
MIKILLTILLLWLFYKIVFEFILPVYHSTKHVRQQMHDIQDRMRQQQYQQQQQQQQSQQPPRPAQKPSDKGDYIDFEEVK